MCFASSVVEAHKSLFIAPHSNLNRSSSRNNSNINTRNSSASTNNNNSNNNTDCLKIKMSRSKSRLQTEVCGDCGASDPSWASINRGILLCADCCSVHRSLGRHISIIKSLRQGTWEPSVLNFVNSLNAHGANSVWEHHLLDGTNAGNTTKGATRLRKPNAKDPLHPNKSDFIKAKHVNLSFVLKPNFQDDDAVIGGSLEQELSKQLHASVRTSNLETSLRLLVQGADPNYFHEEKRSTPLHVAAKFGQASQIELLIVYGADINAIDGNGLTPLEVARANNHNTIAERLMDVLYDVTDRIIMFLGGKKPDHTTGRHLFIPEANTVDISEQLKIARGRLQLVPNKMFEELVMDLYDEVDRRENEAIWATSAINSDNVAVPFLPANPFLSATRNQGRQKLARFSRAEFAGLLTDVLIDARRRQNMANLRPLDANSKGGSAYYTPNTTTSSYNASNNEHDPNLSDDEPIYDPVASDDDYAPVPAMAQQTSGSTENGHKELNYLRKQINEYVSEINQLKTVVQKLSSENTELKSKFTGNSVPQSMAASSGSVYDEPLRIDLIGNESEHELHSMPEGINAVSVASSSSSSANNSNQSTIKRPASMYERRLAQAKVNAELAAAVPRTTTSMYQMAAAAAAAANDKQPPFNEEVKLRTDMVTRRLKELFGAMQESTIHRDAPLVPCAERLRLAVLELIAIFTAPTNCSDTIRETLKQLTRYNLHIQHECENLQNSFNNDDQADIEKYVKELRECVYYIASAVKTILMQFE